jgi:16S rRNA (guanine527-N7)-methyltransferase
MTDDNVRLNQGLVNLGIIPSNMLLSRFRTYSALLEKWNAIYSLTAIRDPRKWIVYHFLDSLSVAKFLPVGSLADIGSGAGFPGLPLAILEHSRQVTLVESSQKKAAFLKHTIAQLELKNVRVASIRVEDLQPQVGFDTVISRAFSSLADFTRLSGHLTNKDGNLFAMKGVYPTEELTKLPHGFECIAVKPLHVPDLDAQRHLVILGKKS